MVGTVSHHVEELHGGDGALGSVGGGGMQGKASMSRSLSQALGVPARPLLQWLQYVYGSCLDLGSLHKQKHGALTGVVRSRCQSCESPFLLWHHGQGSQVLVS